MNKPEPWTIEWFECRADKDDVAHDQKQKEPRGLSVGDPLWRVPLGIGPVGIDHNHWAGDHLTCTEAGAYKIAAVPVMLWTLKEVLLRASMSDDLRTEIREAIKLSELGGTK